MDTNEHGQGRQESRKNKKDANFANERELLTESGNGQKRLRWQDSTARFIFGTGFLP
jgi:hypothetical protein